MWAVKKKNLEEVVFKCDVMWRETTWRLLEAVHPINVKLRTASASAVEEIHEIRQMTSTSLNTPPGSQLLVEFCNVGFFF